MGHRKFECNLRIVLKNAVVIWNNICLTECTKIKVIARSLEIDKNAHSTSRIPSQYLPHTKSHNKSAVHIKMKHFVLRLPSTSKAKHLINRTLKTWTSKNDRQIKLACTFAAAAPRNYISLRLQPKRKKNVFEVAHTDSDRRQVAVLSDHPMRRPQKCLQLWRLIRGSFSR